MIIRRRHTVNFTTIGNALFEDERLAADELGVLAFLLSRPHDWEVRRPALMRRFHIGRDAMKRIVTNLMRCGWCRAQKTRLSNGTFHIIYEIRDEPGPTLSEDEVRGALSLVSSEAAEGDNPGAGAVADRPVGGIPEGDPQAKAPPETGDPPTGQPGVDDQGVAGRSWPKEDSLRTESPRNESTQKVRVFADVRAAWPPEHVLSAVVCEGLHAGLTDKAKDAAFQAVRPYLDECAAARRKICDLATYYRERRWERFAQSAASSPTVTLCNRGTPQAMRWREHFAAVEPGKLSWFDHMMATRGHYTTPSEWPPAKGPAVAAPPTASTLMTPDDEREAANLINNGVR